MHTTFLILLMLSTRVLRSMTRLRNHFRIVFRWNPMEECYSQDFPKIFSVNILGVYSLLQPVLEMMNVRLWASFQVESWQRENMPVLIDSGFWRHSHYSKLYYFKELHASDCRVASIPSKRKGNLYFICVSWRSEDRNDSSAAVVADLDFPLCRECRKADNKWLWEWRLLDCFPLFLLLDLLWIFIRPCILKRVFRSTAGYGVSWALSLGVFVEYGIVL